MTKQKQPIKEALNPSTTFKLQQSLIEWYEKNHRKLPWRETKNPYYIWISEVMLQQTRVDTVIDYYHRFIQKFPTIKDLAEAEEEVVLKAWEGLGYYSRGRRIHLAAKIIMDQHDGRIPERYEAILALPGIGPYTAGAIASIAFQQPVPAVDGNVMRVFSRVFHLQEDITLMRTQKHMQQIGEKVVSHRNPSFFNQGLMELGALICTPNFPKCLACPLLQLCKARALGVQEKVPVKQKKPKQKERVMEMALIYKKDKILITKRPKEGLLGDLWGLPGIEQEKDLKAGRSIELELLETYAIKVSNINYLLKKNHVFTHIKWHMLLYEMKLEEEKEIDYPEIKWVNKNQLKLYPLPTAFKKMIPFTE
ncbi:A/G-specific DNA-adenine glycosylase [Natronincola peptidivorans]|uniref:Adenine DNA glycosylase n=1 Tax=Natronincola peptidivorans TaxID=426128 RepID=A0A1I0BU75_9FIRM|nr:A/G-specific adenine glycosylase [Natronincola peptidivorans]SET10602.1 A/G-specific DNA-adenine glycosylase [Natronincola peptidivorans]